MTDKPRRKTWKREIASAMLVYVGAIGLKAIESPQALEVLKIVISPVMMFAALAYGLSWASDHTTLVGHKHDA